MTQMLASARNVHEVALLLDADVDIIDLKEPEAGALGALSIREVEHIVRHVNGRKCVSATIGDLPMEADLLVKHTLQMAATGVDIVKIGFFGQQEWARCVEALAECNRQGIKTVAVLMADMPLPEQGYRTFLEAGFYGVMLDTADKQKGRLTQLRNHYQLGRFVSEINALGLVSGLAGSLSLQDVDSLAVLKPDYLGFRSAICEAGQRKQAVSVDKVKTLVQLLRKYNRPKSKAISC